MNRIVSAPAGSAGDCEHPLALYNEATGLTSPYAIRCKQRRASRCRTCGERHRRDVARVARSGWLDREVVRAFFVTFTAPGVDVLPWDDRLCTHRPGVRCSGKIGCRARVDELQPWNDSLGQRWSWMMTYIRREFPQVGVQFFKSVEPQRRGALHLHVMFRVDGAICSERFASVLDECARRWEFGPQTDVQEVDCADGSEVARRAGYSSKYASKFADADRAFIDPATGEIVTLRCRAWSKSAKWGVTMKSIDCARRAFARAAASGTPGGAGGCTPQAGAPAPQAPLDLNSDCYTIGDVVMLAPDLVATFVAV